MIKLSRIVEQHEFQSQYYDLNVDFSKFKQMLDNSSETIKNRFESLINSKLKGKRIKARSARYYKQFEKDYEFNVSKVTIDDYYDNYVIVAHDDTGQKKSKEYFLNPNQKITILSDQSPVTPSTAPTVSKSQQDTTLKNKPTPVLKEKSNSVYEVYSIDSIIEDLNNWIRVILINPKLDLREVVKGVGWIKILNTGNVSKIVIYELNIPKYFTKVKLNKQMIENILNKVNVKLNNTSKYELKNFSDDKEQYNLRIKKYLYL